ncbi:MAG: tetratricopeptide repeat protein [Saprospiraceae bacterium]|nr:tetratricopeptide repeat protein [Saprospiraceae bacterium]MBK7795901.1 tetratricopeptide repeat protein [Saprospiraceae bacterium]MBL0261013.1 tetratricopeptide repeat protein [Saprospiraceae bacterium]
MNDLIHTKFKEANQKLENGDIIEFGKCLIDLYANLTCNCYFRDQKEVDYERQLELVCKHSGNQNNFYLNLAKGFIYLRIKNEKEAYTYLTKAIEIDSSCDVPYSLRASIEPEINALYEEDAKTAVLLNPSARNYFDLANSYDYKNDESGLKNSSIYFGKAISLRPDFACAYNNRAIRLQSNKDLQGAVNDYMKCIEVDKKHWAYYQLWFCLDELKRYDEALKYIEIGAKVHSDDISYQFGLGVANTRIGNYEAAIKLYERYLKDNPKNSSALGNIEICKKNIKNQILINAKESYKVRDYKQANDLFEKYIEDETDLNEDDLYLYLLSMLKNNNSETSLDNTNQIYNRLNTLKSSYSQKLENEDELTEEEENANKLMEYQSNYRVGFGNYEGQNLSSIINEDPEYVLWCIINLDHFSINKALFLNPKLRNEPLFLSALEHNLIKEQIIEKWTPGDDDYDYGSRDEYYDDYHDYERDTFDALTDGQLGDWDEFGGDIDDIMTWLGR